MIGNIMLLANISTGTNVNYALKYLIVFSFS